MTDEMTFELFVTEQSPIQEWIESERKRIKEVADKFLERNPGISINSPVFWNGLIGECVVYDGAKLIQLPEDIEIVFRRFFGDPSLKNAFPGLAHLIEVSDDN